MKKYTKNQLEIKEVHLKDALKTYGTHECADVFPLMKIKDILKLSEDIKENGQITPIKILKGEILDGRHRYMACLEANIKPIFEEITTDNPIQYVVSLNQHRRHMNETHRA